LKSLT